MVSVSHGRPSPEILNSKYIGEVLPAGKSLPDSEANLKESKTKMIRTQS